MECSELNHHLFNMHIIDNPICTCGRSETTNRFFIECPQYYLHRVVLIENLTQINVNYNLDTILHGTRDSLLDLLLISLLDIFTRALLYCSNCLGLMYFSADLVHDNDVKFAELRTYLTSCVC